MRNVECTGLSKRSLSLLLRSLSKSISFVFLGKKALEPYNIQYWFKNARAALKRKKRHLIPSESTSVHDYTSKCELDSSDEIDDDDEENDEEPMEDNHVQQPGKNYYLNYLQAFDISLTDPQKVKTTPSDESNDEDNGSFISEQSPSTQLSANSSKVTTFDYNRSRRNRIFIDPSSEVPKLEQWFAIETHPDHILIERICSELNEGEYRAKFPKLESKHIRLWFKNHRAKVKRLGRLQTSNSSNEKHPITRVDETVSRENWDGLSLSLPSKQFINCDQFSLSYDTADRLSMEISCILWFFI